ncbi:methyltransferase-like protein 23 isoform X2 [Anneissia japonica]|nr:methyltransferase-like protein 23 isoform X2 [Anneissia japonica]
MYIWPSAVVLAQYIVFKSEFIERKQILELGAGTSLPGIVAAKLGGDVVLSDSSLLPQCLENCRRSCRENYIEDQVSVVGITWGQYSPALINIPQVDIVLASDCFYDEKDFQDIVVTIAFILNRNQNAKCWVTYQERSSDYSIVHLLRKWKLRCCHIPLETFNASSSSIAESHLPGNHTVRMMEITC